MQSFGDFLPKETKEQLANDNFKVSSVLKYHIDFKPIPKEKRLIIVGFDAEKVLFATVFINTEINPNVFPSKDLQDLHPRRKQQDDEYRVNKRQSQPVTQ